MAATEATALLAVHDDLAMRYSEVRGFTERLTDGLHPEDMVVQSMPDVAVRAARKSIWDAPVAAMTRAVPWSLMAWRMVPAACAAAAALIARRSASMRTFM